MEQLVTDSGHGAVFGSRLSDLLKVVAENTQRRQEVAEARTSMHSLMQLVVQESQGECSLAQENNKLLADIRGLVDSFAGRPTHQTEPRGGACGPNHTEASWGPTAAPLPRMMRANTASSGFGDIGGRKAPPLAVATGAAAGPAAAPPQPVPLPRWLLEPQPPPAVGVAGAAPTAAAARVASALAAPAPMARPAVAAATAHGIGRASGSQQQSGHVLQTQRQQQGQLRQHGQQQPAEPQQQRAVQRRIPPEASTLAPALMARPEVEAATTRGSSGQQQWGQVPQMQQQQQAQRRQPGQQQPPPPPAEPQWRVVQRRIPPEACTLVVRNVPVSLSQEDLLRDLWPADGSWRYFHCPYNLLLNLPLGYVFIDFVSHDLALTFQARWNGHRLPGFPRSRPLDVAATELQGWRALLRRVRSRKLDHLLRAGHGPVLLIGGRRAGLEELMAEARAAVGATPGGSDATREGEGAEEPGLVDGSKEDRALPGQSSESEVAVGPGVPGSSNEDEVDEDAEASSSSVYYQANSHWVVVSL